RRRPPRLHQLLSLVFADAHRTGPPLRVVADSRVTRYLNYDAVRRSVCFLSDCDDFVTFCANLFPAALGSTSGPSASPEQRRVHLVLYPLEWVPWTYGEFVADPILLTARPSGTLPQGRRQRRGGPGAVEA